MEWITNNWLDVLNIISYVIAGASVIVKLTPTPKDDAVLGSVIRFLAVVGLNKK